MKDTKQHINKRITQTLTYLPSVKLEITVPLVHQDGKPVLLDWAKEVTSTLTEHSFFLETQAFIVIKNISKNVDENLDWKKRSLYVSPRTQHIFVKAFDDILRILYDEKNDPFYLDDGHLKTYSLKEDQIVHVENAGDNNVFELEPTVGKDENFKEYEGAALSINSAANTAFLYLDDIETIRNILRDTNIPSLALSLIHLHSTYMEKVAMGKVTYQTREAKPKRNKLFAEENRPPDQESVVDIGMDYDDPFTDLKEEPNEN